MAKDEAKQVEDNRWLGTFKRAFKEFRADDLPTWAAALTYYAVLSVFPAMIAMIALIGVVGSYPQTSDAVLNIVASIAPKDTVNVLRGTVEHVVQSKGGAGALLGIGLIAAIWSASAYIGAFFKAANAIYGVEEGRPVYKLKPLQLGLTILFLIVVAFGSVVFVASGSMARAIGDQVGLGTTFVDVWGIAKWPVLALAVATLLAFLYWAAPNVRHPRMRWLTPGGLIGLVLLVLVSVVFAYYVNNFSSYDKTYGALAAVPIGLTWLWLCNMALLFGAEFDAELERRREIERGMRPADEEPFLQPRDKPKASEGAGDLAREEAAELDGGRFERKPSTRA